MNDHEILLKIQELLSGQEWDAATLDEIAGLLTENGYKVEDVG